MAEACHVAKISPPATFHTTRHTYASHLVQAGVPLLFVAAALGHRDTRMVEKHYGHLAPSHVADAIRATSLEKLSFIGAGDCDPVALKSLVQEELGQVLNWLRSQFQL